MCLIKTPFFPPNRPIYSNLTLQLYEMNSNAHTNKWSKFLKMDEPVKNVSAHREQSKRPGN